MGPASFFALIFLLIAAVQLQSPSAFGQTNAAQAPQATGDPAQNPNLPTIDDDVGPQQATQPAGAAKLCGQLDFLQANEKSNYVAWLAEYQRRSELLKQEKAKQAELIGKLVAKMKDQTDLLKQKLDRSDLSKADPMNGRMNCSSTPIWSSVKDSIKARLAPAIGAYAASKGWTPFDYYSGDGL